VRPTSSVTRAEALVDHRNVAAWAPGSTEPLTVNGAASAAGPNASAARKTPTQRSIRSTVASGREARVNSRQAPPVRRSYGPHPDQWVDVRAVRDARAVVVVIHGGFWRARYGADLMDPLCDDLATRGYRAWNVEYRRVGGGGGWPSTFEDVETAMRAAAAEGTPLVTLGHSAGGHLALWAAARCGADLAVAQAGVTDLREAWERGLSSRAAGELLGGSPDEVPERYAAASPAELLPLGLRQLVVHGRRDDIVPPELSRTYVERARAAGDDVELVECDEGHFECLEPASESWAAIVERLP
jgi:acetyl esterase/lipase